MEIEAFEFRNSNCEWNRREKIRVASLTFNAGVLEGKIRVNGC
jgi:hypothetical protein